MYNSLTVYGGMPEARVTEPTDPGTSHDGAQQGALAYAYWQLGRGDQWGEQSLSHESALTYSVVWACVRVISEALSGVGWHAYERRPDNPRFRFQLLNDTVAWLLDFQANPETSAFDWRQVMLKDALTWGNGYAEIERNNSGKPLWLHQIQPYRVELVRDDTGSLWYKIDNGEGNPDKWMRPVDIFHLKGIGPDGLIGWSVIELARKSIKLGLQEERFGSDSFGKGTMPGGIVTIPGNMDKVKRDEYRREFTKLYAGEENQYRLMVVSNGVTFTPGKLPNNDSQFLESRVFQVNEICRWFGVPPHKVAELTRATFTNIEEQERQFVTDTLLPWARRLESEADIKLFGTIQRGRRFTRLNLDALQRGNSQTQTDTVTKKVQSGIVTLDEAREYFDLNPHPDGLGETPLIQGAMAPVERILEEPEPPPAPMPAQPAPDPEEPQPAEPENIRRVFGVLLVDAYARLIRVDADKARRAANKNKLAQHIAEWYAVPAARERVKAALADTFSALGFTLRWTNGNAGHAADRAAARHIAKCVNDLEERGVIAVDAWTNWPSEAATLDLKGIMQ